MFKSLVMGAVCLAASAFSWGHTPTIVVTSLNVVEVYDGDTFKIDLPGMFDVFGDDLPVRINGIDTPEVRSSCSTAELREQERLKGRDARDYLARLITQGQYIELQNAGRDKYFRVLADVVIDGAMVSTLMIEAGHAVAYDGGTKPSWCGL